jgi:outer membrane protein assembly factor BamB
VQGGLALLSAVAEANQREPETPMRVGVGVHAGETAETGEGPAGSAVNIAARVCAQARAGELLVTDTVRSLTRTRLSVRFVPRGSPRLKGISEPIALFAVEPIGDVAVAGTERKRRPAPLAVAALAAVIVGAVVVGLVLFLGSHANAPAGPLSSGPGGSPSVAPLACWGQGATTLPAVADVAFYRANVDRTSVYPGPGPVCAPQVAWQRTLGLADDFIPIVVDGQVIVGDAAGLHAFDARTGQTSWTVEAPASVEPAGYRESAVAFDHVVFAADVGGTFHAIDAATGTVRWAKAVPNDGLPPTFANGLVWIGSSDGHAHAFDPATGDERWSWDGPANSTVRVGLVTADTAYISAGPDLYAIRLVDRDELWRFPGGVDGLTAAVLDGDTIYVGFNTSNGGATPGSLHAVDRLTGHDRWRPFVIAGGGQIGPGPVRDGILYASANGDGVYALRDAGSEYQVVWHDPDIAFSPRSPSLSGQVLYVQQHGDALVALRAADGTKLWATDPTLRGTESPIVSGGFVFELDDEAGILRALAEPALTALLPSPAPSASSSTAPASTSPSDSPTLPPNPFAIVKPISVAGVSDASPVAIAAGKDGFLYVLDDPSGANPRLNVVDPATGKTVHSWGRYGSGNGQFDLSGNLGNPPTGCIEVAPNGNVYVGEYGNARVQVFDADGNYLRELDGLDSPGGHMRPVYFCRVAADGSLWVVTEPSAGATLSKYGAEGQFLFEVPGIIHSLVIRPDGMVLGLVESGGPALIIDPATGDVVDHWGTGGHGAGQLGVSAEATMDGQGNVYVFRYVYAALQVFDPDGMILGGMYAGQNRSGLVGPGHLSNEVFWPPPVFMPDGAGYTFGADGLIQISVNVGTPAASP